MPHSTIARFDTKVSKATDHGVKGVVHTSVGQYLKGKRRATRAREGMYAKDDQANVPRDGEKNDCKHTARVNSSHDDDAIRQYLIRAHGYNVLTAYSWDKRIQCVKARRQRESKYISILSAYPCNDIPVGEPQCADCSALLGEDLDAEGFKCAMCAGSVGHCGVIFDSDHSAFCGHCFKMVN